MSYVPNINEYIKDTTINRYDIINKMLEHNNPAFIFMSIIDKIDSNTLNECIAQVIEFGEEFDAVVIGNKVDLVSESIIFERAGMKQNEREGGGLGTKNKFKGKLSSGTGHGALKRLVGKGDNDDVTPGEWQQIGHIIAKMEGWNKRDYVGMMNFLNRSCQLYKIIKDTMLNDRRSIIAKKKYADANKPPQAPTSAPTSAPATTPPTDQKALPAGPAPKTALPAHVQEGIIVSYETYNKIFENNEKLKQVELLNMYDIIKLMMNILNQISDASVVSINNEIETIEKEEDVFYNDNAFLYEKYSKGEKAKIRYERGNGKGGLKQLVGLSVGDDLEDSHAVEIAKIINRKVGLDRKKYQGYVNYLGTSCKINDNIVMGYTKTLSGNIHKNSKLHKQINPPNQQPKQLNQ